MTALSQTELYGDAEIEPFSVDLESVMKRKAGHAPASPAEMYERIWNGAINGAVLENYIVAEIIKTYRNCAKDCLLHYYRDKESNEIDIVLESDGMLHPIEIKKSSNPGSELIGAFGILDSASVPRGTGAIICLRNELSAIDRRNLIIPAWMI